MTTCCLCSRTFPTSVAYFEHFAYHSSLLGGALCPIDSCRAVFRNYGTFRSHLFRHHRKYSRMPDSATFVCSVPSCGKPESTRTKIVSHMADHLKNGTDSVSCPFTGCSSVLRSAGSFRTHVSRYHQEEKSPSPCSNVDIDMQLEDASEAELETTPGAGQSQSLNFAPGDRCLEEASSSPSTDANLFARNFALFSLKLGNHHHVPASTVQYIVNEVKNLHKLSQRIVMKNVAKCVPDDTFLAIQSQFTADPLDCASDTLRSSYCRHQYYKANFQFVKPVEISLGLNKHNATSMYHYVPIESLIHFLMSHMPSGKDSTSNDWLEDCPSFRHFEGDVVSVVLYQDEFEIVNPLGSAKGNYKLLGVYMTLGNLPLPCKLRVESLQLVMLCRQKDVKEFGLGQVLQPLIEDLAALENSGVVINRVTHSVRLKFIAGDNLGSHAVGGFTQNFSVSELFFRFCLIARSDFRQEPHVVGEKPTPENYNECVEQLAKGNNSQNKYGVVSSSPFHALKHYHVCDSGLPPCIGHDVFEGVVRYDLPLFISYFVKEKAWFTYDYLNNRISSTKYAAHDLRNKPAKVPSQGGKLAGHAMQNWTFLRLFPLYVGTKVQDTNDPVWQLLLLLTQIVDLLMAPKVTPAQVAYLKALVEDYLTSRSDLFPAVKLRPKHHYMLHYSQLIQEFGPLCHVWSMKFESKHQYFKQCIRCVKNFKNVTKTLTEQHQLYQAFLAARCLFDTLADFTDMSHSDQSKLLNDFRHISILQECVLLKRVTLEGYTYAVQDYVVISGTRFDLVFGLVLGIVKSKDGSMFLLLQHTAAQLAHTLTFYVLQSPTRETVGFKPSDLTDKTAYRPYTFGGVSVIRLNFTFPEGL